MRKIALILLGGQAPSISNKILIRWKSAFFKIDIFEEPAPSENRYTWAHYSDEELKNTFKDKNGYTCTIGVVNYPIIDNYYMRFLSEKRAIISTGGELRSKVISEGYTLDKFILINIYEAVALFDKYNGKFTKEAYNFPHIDTRGCLFDMDVYPEDILIKLSNRLICQECTNKLSNSGLPSTYANNMKKEMQRINKTPAVRLKQFFNLHPIYSVAMSVFSAIVLGVLGSYLYDIFKPILPFLK